jgi:hypothetical protein
MTTDRRSLLLGAAAAAGTALTAAHGVGAQPVRKRPYKIITTEEGFAIPEVLQAQDRYMLTAKDEPGLAGRPAFSPSNFGRYQALVVRSRAACSRARHAHASYAELPWVLLRYSCASPPSTA